MNLGKVVGTVVASQKESSLEGVPLMVVRYLDENGKETGAQVVAADTVGAGTDELVLVACGSSARQTKLTDHRPVDACIMAIVDSWSIDGTTKYTKYEVGDVSEYG